MGQKESPWGPRESSWVTCVGNRNPPWEASALVECSSSFSSLVVRVGAVILVSRCRYFVIAWDEASDCSPSVGTKHTSKWSPDLVYHIDCSDFRGGPRYPLSRKSSRTSLKYLRLFKLKALQCCICSFPFKLPLPLCLELAHACFRGGYWWRGRLSLRFISVTVAKPHKNHVQRSTAFLHPIKDWYNGIVKETPFTIISKGPKGRGMDEDMWSIYSGKYTFLVREAKWTERHLIWTLNAVHAAAL